MALLKSRVGSVWGQIVLQRRSPLLSLRVPNPDAVVVRVRLRLSAVGVEVSWTERGRMLPINLTGQGSNAGSGLSSSRKLDVVIEVGSVMGLTGVHLWILVSTQQQRQ